MDTTDPDARLEQLMRRWHSTTEFAAAAWAEYQALRDALPASDARVAYAHSRWRVAEREGRRLLRALEEAETLAAA